MDKCKNVDFSLVDSAVFTKFRNYLKMVDEKRKSLVLENLGGPTEEEFFQNVIIVTHLTVNEEPILVIQHEQGSMLGRSCTDTVEREGKEVVEREGKEVPVVRWLVDLGNLLDESLIRLVHDFLYIFSFWERKSKGLDMSDFGDREVSVSLLFNGATYLNLWDELEEEYKALKEKEAVLDKDNQHPDESLLSWNESTSIEMYEALMKSRNQNLN